MNVKQLLSLKDRVCLVTGGAGLYGSCIVEGLAEADGTVITASRNLNAGEATAEGLRNRGLDVHALQVDQTESASVESLQKTLRERFGGLDVFVNNAVGRPCKGYQTDVDSLRQSMEVNAVGMMAITRAMADLIAERGGGSIVNISSMMGMFGPDLSNYDGVPEMGDPAPDYFFHRAGMINYTRYLAHVLAPKKIRANCISPGGLFNHQPERFVRQYSSKVMVGRMAERDDIKGLVVFLASRASAYVNGENILMDGGMHC
jgi:NAD(P)-dependent dehydrogenase (short-subunit alcohol dehydrogenase family)